MTAAADHAATALHHTPAIFPQISVCALRVALANSAQTMTAAAELAAVNPTKNAMSKQVRANAFPAVTAKSAEATVAAELAEDALKTKSASNLLTHAKVALK